MNVNDCRVVVVVVCVNHWLENHEDGCVLLVVVVLGYVFAVNERCFYFAATEKHPPKKETSFFVKSNSHASSRCYAGFYTARTPPTVSMPVPSSPVYPRRIQTAAANDLPSFCVSVDEQGAVRKTVDPRTVVSHYCGCCW